MKAGLTLLLMPLYYLAMKLIGRGIRPLSTDWVNAWSKMYAFAEENLGMLAAIKAGVLPRFLARVGPHENFIGADWQSFGSGRRKFIFATEPADLIGCGPVDAMLKVGWTREWIEGAIGKAISVCIFDTSKVIPDQKDYSVERTVDTGRFDWADLTKKATGDTGFVSRFQQLGDSEIAERGVRRSVAVPLRCTAAG